MTKRELQEAIEAIEAQPLSRAERDAMQAQLRTALRDARVEQAVRAGVARGLAREVVR